MSIIYFRFGFEKMDKKLKVAIIVVMLLNITIMLAGFVYLQNEINQLKTEESDLPVIPSTPTEHEPTPELQPEQEPIPEPEPTPESEHQPTPEPEPEAEPEPTETKPAMKAPEAELTGKDIKDENYIYDASIVEVKGFITNPNSLPVYDVSIQLELDVVEMRVCGPIAYTVPETITIGTMAANEVVPINESFDFDHTTHCDAEYKSLSYTVRWSETE